MNPFATHMPLLLACLRHTTGPVLELGSGWFSTPLLAAFATDRLVRTIETNPQWYDRVSQICHLSADHAPSSPDCLRARLQRRADG